MERCSYFIPGKALFGSYPSQETVDLLETEGVRCFIDLTFQDERFINKYKTRFKYINYPIKDRSIPINWISFAQLIVKLCDIIKSLDDNEKVYIHCKGGHGRSGVLVACILCYYYNISPYESLLLTSKCHSERPQMREKWRRLGSPQSKKQKEFVYAFFKPLYFKRNDCEPSNENTELLFQMLEQKFKDCKDILFRTGLRPLIKLSRDLFWGNGLDGSGMNMYGKILVKLRNQMFLNI
jgi:hypothetical protein